MSLGLLATGLIGCSGQSSVQGSDSSGAGNSGMAGTGGAPAAEAETCYVITSDTEEDRFVRAEGGEYSLTSSSWSRAMMSFSSVSQEISVVQSLGGNGYQGLSVHLAADGTIADAEFSDCPTNPNQNVCYQTNSVPASITTCEGTPVSVPSVAGCYDEGPDGYRIVIGGEPFHYYATASKAGGPTESWGATEDPENFSQRRLVLSGGFDFRIGSTGRLWAYASDRNASSYTVFHACMNTSLP